MYTYIIIIIIIVIIIKEIIIIINTFFHITYIPVIKFESQFKPSYSQQLAKFLF